MQLFVIRHALALPACPHAPSEARPLSARGRRRWRRAVHGLARLGLRFDRLYHSPWLRAVETADALYPLVDEESAVCLELARPPGPTLLRALRGDRVALVGHQPWLGELIALLLEGEGGDGQRWALGRGGLAWLEGEPRSAGMRLRGLFPPRVLRAGGRRG